MCADETASRSSRSFCTTPGVADRDGGGVGDDLAERHLALVEAPAGLRRAEKQHANGAVLRADGDEREHRVARARHVRAHLPEHRVRRRVFDRERATRLQHALNLWVRLELDGQVADARVVARHEHIADVARASRATTIEQRSTRIASARRPTTVARISRKSKLEVSAWVISTITCASRSLRASSCSEARSRSWPRTRESSSGSHTGARTKSSAPAASALCSTPESWDKRPPRSTRRASRAPLARGERGRDPRVSPRPRIQSPPRPRAPRPRQRGPDPRAQPRTRSPAPQRALQRFAPRVVVVGHENVGAQGLIVVRDLIANARAPAIAVGAESAETDALPLRSRGPPRRERGRMHDANGHAGSARKLAAHVKLRLRHRGDVVAVGHLHGHRSVARLDGVGAPRALVRSTARQRSPSALLSVSSTRPMRS